MTGEMGDWCWGVSGNTPDQELPEKGSCLCLGMRRSRRTDRMQQRKCLAAGWIVGSLAPSWTDATSRLMAAAMVEVAAHCFVVVVGRNQRYPDHGFASVLAEVSWGSMPAAGTRRTALIAVRKARLGIASVEACCPWRQDAGAPKEGWRDSDKVRSSNKLVDEVQQLLS